MSSPTGCEAPNNLNEEAHQKASTPDKHGSSKRRLLLLEDPRFEESPAVFLEGLLRQALEVICKLFEGRIEELGTSDHIKDFTASIERAKDLGSSYALGNYYTTMFLLQQWFHSSYRARQGKVLEHLLRYALVKRARIDSIVLPKNNAKLRKFFAKIKTEPFEMGTINEIMQKLYPNHNSTGNSLGDVDVLAVVHAETSFRKAIAIQIRSRDDTGGTTAKGSLVDFLKKMRDLGVPQFEVLYLIAVWEEQNSSQKSTTVSKIINALEKETKGKEEEQTKPQEMFNALFSGERYLIKERIYLQLRYGRQCIQQAIDDWVKVNNSSSANDLEELAREFVCWDDFWLAYAVATIEIHNKKLTGKSNIDILLNAIRQMNGIADKLSSEKSTHADFDKAATDIVKTWREPCQPFNAPSDMFLYIRDLLYLYAIYRRHCTSNPNMNQLFGVQQEETTDSTPQEETL